jgi:hypothetical protein
LLRLIIRRAIEKANLKKIMKASILFLMTLCVLSTLGAQVSFTKIISGPVVNEKGNSTGTTWVDIDGDGDLDLFVNDYNKTSLLYRNEGGGVFTKITGPSVSKGLNVSWADVDNDGRIDMFTSSDSQGGRLFRQLSPGVFTATTVGGSSLGSALADYDNDGFLDLIAGDTTQSVLWHNNGNGAFVAVRNTPIITTVGNSGAVLSWADYDNDGDLDLLVATPTTTTFYRNDGGGIFKKMANGVVMDSIENVGGMTWGDYNNDGYLDVYLSRNGSFPLPSLLYHNNGNGTFTLVDQSPFKDDLGYSLNANWGDYDNDGWLDLFATEAQYGQNRLYHNNGDGTFTRVLTGPINEDLAISGPGAWGDYDQDGFLDLFVTTGLFNGPSEQPNDYLYHNEGNANAWLTVKCVGTRSNRSAIGAKVRLKATIKGKTFWQLRHVTTGDGWSGYPLELHFGLGDATNVETLSIEWPSGTVQELTGLAANQIKTITEPAQILLPAAAGAAPPFVLHGGRNLQYDLQASTDLRTWSSFNTLTITNLDGKAPFTDPAPSSDFKFYRALLH